MHDNFLFAISWGSHQTALFSSHHQLFSKEFPLCCFHFTINSINSCIPVLLLMIESNKLHRRFLSSNLYFGSSNYISGMMLVLLWLSLIMSIESCTLLPSSLNRCFHSSNVGDLSDPERFSSPSAHILFDILSHQVTTSHQLLRSWTQIHSIRNWLFGLYTSILCWVISFFRVVSEGTAKFIRHWCWYCMNGFPQ